MLIIRYFPGALSFVRRNVLPLLSLFALMPHVAFAQTKVMPEYALNKNYPGATYKFSFIHITDTHIGEGGGDYGTEGFLNDTAPAGDIGEPAQRLRAAVDWINANYQAKDLRFILLSGDLTDSGEKSEFEKLREIMSDCRIPYVPVMGNHDAWPYVRLDFESHKADGDSMINAIFEDVYDSCRRFFPVWNDGTRLTPVFNPETQNTSYLQNFYFGYEGFLFMALDFNPRYHVVLDNLTQRPAPGIGPEAQVMDWEGGTYRWLQSTLQTLPGKANRNIILYSHHPPTRDIFATWYAFDLQEYTQVSNLLYAYRQHMGLWLCGHIHREKLYKMATVNSQEIMPVFETGANKEYDSAQVKIIQVYEVPGLTAVEAEQLSDPMSLYPNPSPGVFYMETETFEPGARMDVLDAAGRLVLTKNLFPEPEDHYRVDLGGLPKGTYYITISDPYRTYTEFLVVQ